MNITYSNIVTDEDMRLTPAAEAKMAELLDEAGEFDALRIFVTGGGCSGMAYGMTYAEEISEYDSTLDGNGYKIIVDPVALNFMKGCEIGFDQSSFTFSNVFQAIGGSGACGGCGGGGF